MEIVGSSSSGQGESFLGDELCGYSIRPKRDCAHLNDEGVQIHAGLQEDGTSVGGGGDGKQSVSTGDMSNGSGDGWSAMIRCETCGDIEETWVCLQCGVSKCGRYRQGDMVEHWKDGNEESDNKNGCRNVIAMSTVDLSTWCFECDEYVTNPKLNTVYRKLHRLKFGTAPVTDLH